MEDLNQGKIANLDPLSVEDFLKLDIDWAGDLIARIQQEGGSGDKLKEVASRLIEETFGPVDLEVNESLLREFEKKFEGENREFVLSKGELVFYNYLLEQIDEYRKALKEMNMNTLLALYLKQEFLDFFINGLKRLDVEPVLAGGSFFVTRKEELEAYRAKTGETQFGCLSYDFLLVMRSLCGTLQGALILKLGETIENVYEGKGIDRESDFYKKFLRFEHIINTLKFIKEMTNDLYAKSHGTNPFSYLAHFERISFLGDFNDPKRKDDLRGDAVGNINWTLSALDGLRDTSVEEFLANSSDDPFVQEEVDII